MITPDQIRAARALKGWSQGELAARTGLAVPTIANIEIGKQEPSVKTMDKIVHAFEINGIEFITDRGVQKRRNQTRVFRGVKDFSKFYQDIYETLREKGGEVVVANADEREFLSYLDDESILNHQINMRNLADTIKYKILIKEGDVYFAGNSYAEYRWTPEKDFQSIPFYVYGNKLAIILWLDEPLVFLIESDEASDIYREKFSTLWENSIIPAVKPKEFKEYMVDSMETLVASRKKMGINKKAGK
jgi:transcriptional regulator with XRE-family HTH domain